MPGARESGRERKARPGTNFKMTADSFHCDPRSMTPQQVREFFDAHWTVRKYKSFTMPDEHVDVLLHAAQRAPTDATSQMYTFVRLTDPALRAEIARLTTNAHIATASLAFIVCGDVHRLAETLRAHGHEFGHMPTIAHHFAIGDAVLAGQSLLLAAEMLGYRGCWIGGVMNALDEIVALTKLPSGVVPFAALTIGVPDEAAVHRPRIARDLVVHENTYRPYSHEELEQSARDMAAITARGNWAQTLARYWSPGGSMEAREPHLARVLGR